MDRKLISIAALLGMLAVALGAFGAHGLKKLIAPDQLAIFQTGVTYQVYHTFAIFICVILASHFKQKIYLRAAWFFVVGILFFSGSLYLLATRAYLGTENWAGIIGPITPIGGLLFMIGWGMIAYGGFKK